MTAPPLTIFHTADLHGRLPPDAVRRLVELKQAHPGCLLLDAGDAVSAGNLTYRLAGEPVLRRMAEAGYDAMAMGNRESHPTRRILERKLRDAAFPVLTANLRASRRPVPDIVRPYALFDLPSRRVAVIGLSCQVTRPDSLWARVTDYVFGDPLSVAAELAPRLRPEADVVVALSHCGLSIDARLAELPEIDLVLGGHTHATTIERTPGGVLVVHPGHHAHNVAQTTLNSRQDASSVLLPLQVKPQ